MSLRPDSAKFRAIIAQIGSTTHDSEVKVINAKICAGLASTNF